jgi:nucleoside-diphosphate-sugar epimerase
MRALVTGATGFVGSALCRLLAERGYTVRALVRPGKSLPRGASESAALEDLATPPRAGGPLDQAMEGVDVVFHLAAIAHILNPSPQSLHRYDAVNAEGTRHLLDAARRAGVRRFVYLSSVKVNGEATYGRPFTTNDDPAPSDAYARSKLQGEKYLMEAGRSGALGVVAVRAPLVYGPGVRANFLRLVWLADRGWPLPLGKIDNARSLVSVWNLVDLLVCVAGHPSATGRVWMASDGDDLSTPRLLAMLGDALGRKVRLFRFPPLLLRLLATVSGKSAEFERLCGSLVVDSSDTRKSLGWTPPVTVGESIARTVEWYRSDRGSAR